MKKLLFIKFGGGVLTDKRNAYALNERFIDLLPEILPRDLLGQYDVILGSGGGSFAHYEAKKANLPGKISDQHRRVGVGKTHLAAQELQSVVARKLLAGGWPVFTVSPSAIIHDEQLNIAILRRLWRDGLVPLVHGDVVTSSQSARFDIFSTEKIAELILSECRNDYKEMRVVFLTDVAGVIKDGKVLPSISPKDRVTFAADSGFDVTGSMAEKVRAGVRLADMGASVVIAGGFEPNVITRILAGESVGTHVVR